MSDDWQAYVNDPRNVCKYGLNCYQKNPAHHETFKHPPIRTSHETTKNPPRCKKERFQPYKKKTNQNDVKKVKQGETSTSLPETPAEDYFSASIILPENISFYSENTDRSIIKKLFLVEMPPDFYKFYEFLCESQTEVEKMLAGVNLELIGPYDLLTGKLPELDDKDLYLIHWRFFYDPPEFQAVLKRKGKSEYHIGYFRDSPEEMPVFLASNDSAKDCHITPMADNIFGAVYVYLQNEKKSSPFVAMACEKLMEKIKQAAVENNYSLEEYNLKKRWSTAVTKTFHGAGIVVPMNKKTDLGYRHLVESDGKIKELFNKLRTASTETEKDEILSELQPIITYANIAVDEYDFGTGLELGIDLFCSGLKILEKNALNSLTSVYNLLKRTAFSKIIEVHLKYRRKGPNMSIINK